MKKHPPLINAINIQIEQEFLFIVLIHFLSFNLVLERTPKYRTSNTSNINTPNFEHIEHATLILRPNFEQARPNIEL